MLGAALSSGGGGRLPALLSRHRHLSGSTSIAALFSDPSLPADPSAAIQSAGVDLSHPDTVPALLLHPDLAGNYAAASRFFCWAASQPPAAAAALNSRSFNSMLQLAAANGDADRFWSLVSDMRARGYGISKPAFRAASESFRAKDMARDADLLQEAYAAHARNAAAAEVCKVLRSPDKDETSKLAMLGGSGIEVTDELVALVVKVGQFPPQAMVFFRWVEQSAGAGISWAKVYNAMARVLGREDCIEEFQEVLRKMRGKGLQMERDVYVTVIDRFLKRKMVEDAVDLFRFMTGRPENLSAEDFMFLLKKVVVTGDLDLKLVTRVVWYFHNAGNDVKASAFDAVLKSLRSVGRLGESGRVLMAMEEGGFAPGLVDHEKAFISMCDAGNLEEAREYLAGMEKSGYKFGPKIWSILVQKYSLGENVDMAVTCFYEMLERSSNENMGSALEVLVSGLYKKKGEKEAFKVTKNLVSEKAVVPWQTTYKYLIHKLTRQGHLKEAFEVLDLMKSNGFPPFIDPFVAQISKSGTVDDALCLLNATTSKGLPSRRVYGRLFQALFKEGRHEIAQQLLAQSPASVQNHADVRDLFDRMKQDGSVAAALADG